MEGLQDFSHIWLFFIFDQDIGKYCKMKTKNDCPKVEEKKGVFATRSPCRFNPIGISAVKVERVDAKNGVVYVSGIDLINNTQIIDIKPYIQSDVIAEAKFASWIKDVKVVPDVKVEIESSAQKEIGQMLSEHKLEFYDKPEEILELINEVFIQGPHSKSAIADKRSGLFAICLDNMEIVYTVNANFDHYKILKILPCNPSDTTHIKSLRTEPWLKKMKELLAKEKLMI